MSTMETPPPPPDATTTPLAPPERRCPRCGSTLAPDQEWCLACGAAAGTEVVETSGWRVPMYLGGGLVALAVLGVILAIVALSNQEEPTGERDADAGSLRRSRPGDADGRADDPTDPGDADAERHGDADRDGDRRPSPTETATVASRSPTETATADPAPARSPAGPAATATTRSSSSPRTASRRRREGRAEGAGRGLDRRHPQLGRLLVAERRLLGRLHRRLRDARATPRPTWTACGTTSRTRTSGRSSPSRRLRPPRRQARDGVARERVHVDAPRRRRDGVDPSTSTGMTAAIERLSAPRS